MNHVHSNISSRVMLQILHFNGHKCSRFETTTVEFTVTTGRRRKTINTFFCRTCRQLHQWSHKLEKCLFHLHCWCLSVLITQTK